MTSTDNMTTAERAKAVIERLLPLCEGKALTEVENIVKAESRDTIDDLKHYLQCGVTDVAMTLAVRSKAKAHPNYNAVIYDASADQVILS